MPITTVVTAQSQLHMGDSVLVQSIETIINKAIEGWDGVSQIVVDLDLRVPSIPGRVRDEIVKQCRESGWLAEFKNNARVTLRVLPQRQDAKKCRKSDVEPRW